MALSDQVPSELKVKATNDSTLHAGSTDQYSYPHGLYSITKQAKQQRYQRAAYFFSSKVLLLDRFVKDALSESVILH